MAITEKQAIEMAEGITKASKEDAVAYRNRLASLTVWSRHYYLLYVPPMRALEPWAQTVLLRQASLDNRGKWMLPWLMWSYGLVLVGTLVVTGHWHSWFTGWISFVFVVMLQGIFQLSVIRYLRGHFAKNSSRGTDLPAQ